ncbi:MAG: DMT family transporter [Bacteroidia bacterium]|nr:MAG: DMT family transporter [Bacteroidia bacterium]
MFWTFLLLVILGVDWASGYAIAGYVITHGVHPLGYAFWQSAGPLALLALVQLFRRDLGFYKSGVYYALFAAIFGIVIPNLLFYFVVQHVDSGVLTVIANVAPIFTYPLAIIYAQESPSCKRFVAVIVGVVGVILLVSPLTFEHKIYLSNAWLYIALIIPVCYAFSAVFVARFRPSEGNILSYSFWMLLVSTILISPMTYFYYGYYPLKFGDSNTYLIVIEMLLSAFGYVLLFFIIKKAGPVYYMLVNAITAMAGVIYGKILFGQYISGKMYLGIFLILLAIIGLTYLQNNWHKRVVKNAL